ncbi:MAG: hypothetical protein ATN31_09955 [Candidatus Epulonipiscioides saccharophilum]|nr:MAG: hypothetical protein ATN31_09955 [Epulopiscium sp. AS2M-Bin001]
MQKTKKWIIFFSAVAIVSLGIVLIGMLKEEPKPQGNLNFIGTEFNYDKILGLEEDILNEYTGKNSTNTIKGEGGEEGVLSDVLKKFDEYNSNSKDTKMEIKSGLLSLDIPKNDIEMFEQIEAEFGISAEMPYYIADTERGRIQVFDIVNDFSATLDRLEWNPDTQSTIRVGELEDQEYIKLVIEYDLIDDELSRLNEKLMLNNFALESAQSYGERKRLQYVEIISDKNFYIDIVMDKNGVCQVGVLANALEGAKLSDLEEEVMRTFLLELKMNEDEINECILIVNEALASESKLKGSIGNFDYSVILGDREDGYGEEEVWRDHRKSVSSFKFEVFPKK